MNLFLKSYKIYLIFFLIIALKGSELLGNRQDSIHFLNPRILKYNLPGKHFKTANTSFYKSGNGVIYIGKENGLMVLDGSSNYFLSMEGPVFITSCCSGHIHYLASNDFGTINYNPSTGIMKSSQIDRIDSHDAQFLPYNMLAKDSLLLMATSAGVFIIKEDQYQHLFFNRQECNLLESEESIFLNVCKEGLYILKDTEFVIAINSAELDNERIAGILESDNEYKILTSKGESFICDKSFSNLSRVNPSSIKGKEILLMKTLPDGNQLIKTIDNTIFLYSEEGEIINAPGKSGSLPSLPIKNIFVDEFNDIWILYKFALYKLEYPSNVYSLMLPDAVAGKVLNTLVEENHIYIGTNNGIHVFETLQNEKWIWNINRQSEDEYINLLENIDERVFAAGNKSLFEINGNDLIKIDDGNFSALTILNKDFIFACNEEGIKSYSKSGEYWEEKLLDPSQTYVSDMKVFLDRLWFIGEGLKITSIDYMSESIKKFDLPEDNAEQFIVDDKQLYIVGGKRLWYWNDTCKNSWNMMMKRLPVYS